ncbi:uncharacterized protein BO66DRAFT_435041 [Aspergillus aculeatinus CBS 121060]|uniref:Uncharacterized protein n=1 Tax=Aspergillus aculeatinus CBS 121060 TaxID=1448322 RepID=A0ACD1HKA7_9EURO|nr:hypothetical protein BO66DRAFT_435041 [Aspergillus aculeatinus CBS 121060]RAH74054.1 hypothetical protein BO66DRAFT_435041 [Aspergillus aculeatinus CBS 121060]
MFGAENSSAEDDDDDIKDDDDDDGASADDEIGIISSANLPNAFGAWQFTWTPTNEWDSN